VVVVDEARGQGAHQVLDGVEAWWELRVELVKDREGSEERKTLEAQVERQMVGVHLELLGTGESEARVGLGC
jgi:hypothetical protein